MLMIQIKGKKFDELRELRDDMISKVKEANRLTTEAHNKIWAKISEIAPETKGRNDIEIDVGQENQGIYMIRERKLTKLEEQISKSASKIGENHGKFN